MVNAICRSLLVGAMLAAGFIICGPAGAVDPPAIGIEEGQMYPDFMLPTVDGDVARLSDYRGKKIILFHFASW